MMSFKKKKLMSQSQENFWTEEWKDGKTDRPQFIGPSGHDWRSNKNFKYGINTVKISNQIFL